MPRIDGRNHSLLSPKSALALSANSGSQRKRKPGDSLSGIHGSLDTDLEPTRRVSSLSLKCPARTCRDV